MPPPVVSQVEGCNIKTSRSSGTITSTSGQRAKRALESFFAAIADGISLNVNYVRSVSKEKKALKIQVWKNNLLRRSKIFEDVYKQVATTNSYMLQSNKLTDYNTLIESIENFNQTGTNTAMKEVVNMYFRNRETKIRFHQKKSV